MESKEAMAQFLAPTPLCDCDSAGIKDKAKDLAGTAEDPSEAALSVFYFVRDKITFGLYFPDAKASKTLDHGSGFCMTKTNLQMALLRAAGVPSRCHLVQLPKQVNQAFLPAFFLNHTPDLIVHPWCECYLHERWIACDSVLDDAFYHGMLKGGHLDEADMPSIDWDGTSDLMFGKPWIQADLGAFPSWDEGLIEAQKHGGVPPTNRAVGPVMFAIANRRVRDIRTSAS